VPPVGHPDYEPVVADLERLFSDRAVDGHVRFEYETQLFVSRVA
jgi:hypothetical protein